MKQCISWVIKIVTQLWRTLKRYVCRIRVHRKDVNNDGIPDLSVSILGQSTTEEEDAAITLSHNCENNNNKEE